MRKPGISMCVSCKNSEKTLKACITSFMDFADEIIIVDNKSSDKSIKIAEELAAKETRLQKQFNMIRKIYESGDSEAIKRTEENTKETNKILSEKQTNIESLNSDF